jgi:hypothetical protein
MRWFITQLQVFNRFIAYRDKEVVGVFVRFRCANFTAAVQCRSLSRRASVKPP